MNCDIGKHLNDDCASSTASLKRIKQSLREITTELYQEYKDKGLNLVPGKKLCTNCRKDLLRINLKSEDEHEQSESSSAHSPAHSSSDDFADFGTDIDCLNKSLGIINETPIKVNKLISKKKYPEEKYEKITGESHT